VNRKAQKAALRSALASHAQEGTIAIVAADDFKAPSTKQAKALVDQWGKQSPLVLVALQEEEALRKSFRNLDRVAVIGPSEVEVAAIVWARSLVVSEGALPLVQGKAQ
jgi:large subunit ribosomal protein L4